MQVVVLNIFILSILVPITIISLSANRWLFGEYGCAIYGDVMTYFTRIFLMLVLVIDRFMTVSMPYFYPKYRRKVVCTMSSIVWLFLGSYCIILLPGMLDCYAYSSLGYQCIGSPSCSQICAIILNIVNVLIIFAVILPTVLYFVLFGIARRSRRGIAAANDRDATFEREWRATITICLMFTALFLLILPVFICVGVHFLISLFSEVPEWFDIVVLGSVDVFTLLSIMDPIFIMRNRDMREVISKLIQNVCHIIS